MQLKVGSRQIVLGGCAVRQGLGPDYSVDQPNGTVRLYWLEVYSPSPVGKQARLLRES